MAGIGHVFFVIVYSLLNLNHHIMELERIMIT